jgi:uncharacterized membrane protein YeaQ/YmgE (transglycosylase-associated protein family)
MGLLSWLVVGFIAGGLARLATGAEKRGCLGTIAIGILGALLGGLVFSAIGKAGVTDFSLWSIFVAFVGASLLLLLLQALGGRGRR